MLLKVNKALIPPRGCKGAHGLGQKSRTMHICRLPVQGARDGKELAAESSFFSPIYFRPRWNSCFPALCLGKPRVLPIPGFKQHVKKSLLSWNPKMVWVRKGLKFQGRDTFH